MELSIQLLVLRCRNIEETMRFYNLYEFSFQKEKHGKGPEHYAADNFGFVLELYQVVQGDKPDNVRVGFSTPYLSDISGNLLHAKNVFIEKRPYDFEGKLCMLVQDPDGRKVEVSQPIYV